MPNLDYSYPSTGGYRLTTDGAVGGGGLSDPSGMMDFYKEMAMRRMAQQDADRQMALRDRADAKHEAENARSKAAYDEAAAKDAASHRYTTAHMQAAERGEVTPEMFGRRAMDIHGNWGTAVDAEKIPVQYQDKILGGFYGNETNAAGQNTSAAPHQIGQVAYGKDSGSSWGASETRGGAAKTEAEIEEAKRRADWGSLGSYGR